MNLDSAPPAMAIAMDLFKAGQKPAPALVYAELAEQATILAAMSTKAGHPITGAYVGAHCAVESPDDWHAWTELGVALARVALSEPAAHPLRVAEGPLDRRGLAGAGRACLSRAIALEPAMKRYGFYTELMAELHDAGLDTSESPLPFAMLPAELLAHSGPVRVGQLSPALRADLLAFLDRQGLAFTIAEEAGTPSEEEDDEENDSDEESDNEEQDSDEENDSDQGSSARSSSPQSPAPGRARPSPEALQFIIDQVRKDKRSTLWLGPGLIAVSLFVAYAFYVERESSGWAKAIFMWALCALGVAAGISSLRKCLRPPEKDPEVILLATRPEQVVWAHVEIQKTNGVHSASSLKLYTETGESLAVPVPPTTEGAARALAVMKELAPRATLGFSPENEALFAKDPAALRRS
ncbi:MAG: hypothetical protein U0359_19735 [Byssovorax sp.]